MLGSSWRSRGVSRCCTGRCAPMAARRSAGPTRSGLMVWEESRERTDRVCGAGSWLLV